MEVDVDYIPFYCIFMALWITVMNQIWNRKENQLAFEWDIKTFQRKDAEREQFSVKIIICVFFIFLGRASCVFKNNGSH
jgi:hypothetical protein